MWSMWGAQDPLDAVSLDLQCVGYLAAGADALVVVTDWNEYRFPDFGRIKSSLKAPVVIDGRNLYDPAKMAQLGFTYRSVGRGRE